jgi:lysophospholipase L1-like esterase
VLVLVCAVAVLLGVRRGVAEPNYLAEAVRNYGLSDVREPAVKHGVLFVGSSSIRLWPTQKYFPNLRTVNRGLSGSRIPDVYRWFADLVLPYEPEIIVFYSGDNDIAAGGSPTQVFMDYDAFVRLVHEHFPQAKILFLSIKPSPVRLAVWDKMRQANHLVELYSQCDERLYYVDVASQMLGPDGMPRGELFRPDGLHLNDAGYRLWSGIVGRIIEEIRAPAVRTAVSNGGSPLGPVRAPCGGS